MKWAILPSTGWTEAQPRTWKHLGAQCLRNKAEEVSAKQWVLKKLWEESGRHSYSYKQHLPNNTYNKTNLFGYIPFLLTDKKKYFHMHEQNELFHTNYIFKLFPLQFPEVYLFRLTFHLLQQWMITTPESNDVYTWEWAIFRIQMPSAVYSCMH